MLMPAAPLAVKLLNGLLLPTAPPNTIDPEPALTVSARGVDDESLLTVPLNVMIPELEDIDMLSAARNNGPK